MSRTCCKLHRFLDSENFLSFLDNERYKDFCSFLQASSNKKNRSLVPMENPNDKEVYIYLFGGVGTRYLTTVLGEFITFIPHIKTNKTKWFPVIGIKQTVQTKSLTILGSGKLPIALLLLLSYYENNLKFNHDCDQVCELTSHMSISSLIPCLLYMLEHTNDLSLQLILINKLTNVTLCDNSDIINSFKTSIFPNSYLANPREPIGYFDNHLTFNCINKLSLTSEEQKVETWKNKILILLMTKNWTETQSGWNNSSTTSTMELSNFQFYQQQQPLPHLLQTQSPPHPPPPMQTMQIAYQNMNWNPESSTSHQHRHQFQQPWPEFK